MTATATREAPTVTSTPDETKASRPVEQPTPRGRRVAVGVSLGLSLLLVLLIGFAAYVYGLSGLSEKRQQINLRKNFTHSLGQALAPVGPTTEGTSVAALSIPKLGISNLIVVEGTRARDLTNGPGHLTSSPLPGQAGTSVIFGRRVSFGAPFAHLMRLDVGDTITVATGQAISKYVVSSFGNDQHFAPANAANRLVLVTAASSGAPTSAVMVSADLKSAVQPSGGVGAVSPDMASMADGFTASLLPMLLWSQALLALVILTTIGWFRWNRAALYLIAAPTALVVLWNLYENGAAMLPNLF